MTGEALHRQLVFVQITLVAGITFQRRAVFAQEWEFGLLVVIEDRFLPVILIVTDFALGTEFPLVRFIIFFFMAREARQL
jgi:hypothetical protein